jgi:hypothetical protein
LAGLCLLGSLVAGCGDSSTTASGGGQVTDAWRAYCVATFTKDYTVTEFSEPLFQAHTGDAYLMSEYGEKFGDAHAELLYLTSAGPYSFSIDAPGGSSDFPFTTNCTFDAATSLYAVFANVSVYDSLELKNKLCDLPANTVKLRDTGSMAGYESTDNSFNFSGNNTYEVYLNAFSGQCGGAKTGFVSVPMVEVLGTHTWLVPITSLIGPS